MKNLTFLAVLMLVISGCSVRGAKYEKRSIYEPSSAITSSQNIAKSATTEEMAQKFIQNFAQKSGGTKFRRQSAQYVYFEEIMADGGSVVYNYTLSSGWASLSNKHKEKYLHFTQVELVNHACNAQSSRILLQRGMKFVHKYFYDYPNSPIFDILIDENICQSAGL